MKNIILILVAAVTLNVFADYGTQGRSANKNFAGAIENAESQYINVLNKEGASISAGMLVVWDVANDDGASVIIDTGRTNVPACVMVASCSDGKMCKCQTYGYVSSLLFDSSAGAASASGKFYISGENAGYVSSRAPLSSEQIGSIQAGGFFYDTPSASAAVEAFIKLR